MRGSFLKGALVGGLSGGLVMLASTALAGSGIGAVFNLGVRNSVNATSALVGRTTGSMLRVKNVGTGPAASFQVAAGKAPFAVNSAITVANLNADLLDGLDSSAFLPVGGKAADSDKLDGIDSTGFLSSGPGAVGPANLANGAVTNAKVANDVIRHVAYNVARVAGGNAAFWNFNGGQLYATCFTNFGISLGVNNNGNSDLSENFSWIDSANAAHDRHLVLPPNVSGGPLVQSGSGNGTGNIAFWNAGQTVTGSFTYLVDANHCEFHASLVQATGAQD